MSNNLFFLSLADIFSVYPQIFKDIMSSRVNVTKIYLPSDVEWQDKMYYMLLEVQKTVNEAIEGGKNYEEVLRLKERPVFDSSHIQRFSPASSPTNEVMLELQKRCRRTTIKSKMKEILHWSLQDICMAAQLLQTPAEKVSFSNEHQMRKVYSLIYDVFRYKSVLRNALTDVQFFKHYPKYEAEESRVWLMLYELHDRSFRKRNAEEKKEELLMYSKVDVKDLSDCLWESRKKFAASFSRMRIKYGALRLSQLLPKHLQNEKVALAATNPVVTGWVNPFLVSNREEAEKQFVDFGFELLDCENELQTSQFKWDNLCPLFLQCIPFDRNEFAKSNLVTKRRFIIQDRTFSLGPAVMSRLLAYFDLSGDILQTHVDSPRSTAYLASLFYSVNRINYFYVYGAGSNLKQYRQFIDGLGINNIRLFAESFTSFPLESNRFRTVVGIFANPPNSFSAISDPIDLICSRGGDLGMIEILTDTSISDDGKYRVSLILEDQYRTLLLAMSRPQVQFILYQTHSIVNSENSDMINCAIKTINDAALQKHYNMYLERKRIEALEAAEALNIPSAAMNASSPRKRNVNATKQAENNKSTASETDSSMVKGESEEADNTEKVILPDVDKFFCVELPDVCKNQDNCLRLHESGCFLSLVQRKQITRLNAKYLILMAEKRGLFGKGTDAKLKTTKQQIKSQNSNTEKLSLMSSSIKHRTAGQNINFLISRLMTPTNASSTRSNSPRFSFQKQPISFGSKRRFCNRYNTLHKRKDSLRFPRRPWNENKSKRFKKLFFSFPVHYLNI